jgi:hypothetical protein
MAKCGCHYRGHRDARLVSSFVVASVAPAAFNVSKVPFFACVVRSKAVRTNKSFAQLKLERFRLNYNFNGISLLATTNGRRPTSP